MDFDVFFVVFIVMFVLAFLIIIFSMLMAFSPKMRAKMLKRQIRNSKMMLEEAKDDLTDLSVLSSEIGIGSHKKVIDRNKNDMKDIATESAKINEDAVTITTAAIKKGLSSSKGEFCKHCGKEIDDDSVFCKFCGKNVK